MPINYTCPHCGAAGVAEDQYAGQTGPCAECGQQITIAAEGQPQQAALVSSAPPPKKSSGTIWIILGVVGLCGFCFVGLLVAALLPAIQSARESARRVQCANNLKQIGLALHSYEFSHRSFPPAYTVDEEGNKLHSWRTLLLPYLEENNLYEEIAFDEPWDSPHNSQFHDIVLPLFNCPSSSDDALETNYMVVVGDGTIFPPAGEATSISEIRDGASNTIIVVEVSGNGVHWMEPSDLNFDNMTFAVKGGPDDPSSEHPRLVSVCFADGSVQTLDEGTNSQVLRDMLTRNGGEVVERWDW